MLHAHSTRRGRLAVGCVVAALTGGAFASATAQSPKSGDRAVAALRGAGEPSCVFVDGLVLTGGDVTQTLGPATAARAGMVVSGMRCDHALEATVDAAAPGDATATLTIRLNRAYARFRAQPCREDRFAADGAAPASFEVWGDDALLYQGDPLRPAGRVIPARGVDVSVRGVTTLRLVVRYADIDVSAPIRQIYARGCVWAMARLLPPPDTKGDDPIDAARLRGLLRAETARLTALAAKAAAATQPPTALPLRVYVGAMAGESTDFGDQVRSVVGELLSAADVGETGSPVFSVVGDTGGKRRRGRRRPSADENRPEAQREAARSAGADWLLLLALEPSADNNSAGSGAASAAAPTGSSPAAGGAANLRLTLRIVSARDTIAAPLASVEAPAPDSAAVSKP